jgi:hypothetical protein
MQPARMASSSVGSGSVEITPRHGSDGPTGRNAPSGERID